jgi:signal transduction histidine kinase
VVLLDVKMPDMDGFETATLIRQREETRHIPIIFVTAYGQTDTHLARSYSLGGVDYIQTPIIPEILRAKVDVFVKLYKKSQKIAQQSAELHKRIIELTETNRELEAFSYSLSHDLRAPLRAINNFTSLVLEDCSANLGANGTDLLKRVISAATRMERLMQDLLALGRVSRRKIRFELIDVQNLLEAIIGERAEWQSTQAEISIDRSILPMVGDEASLTQCLTNLISNAVKFVAAGVVPRLRIYSQASGDGVRLWVEDNGIGIQNDAHKMIFETFQRIPQSTEYEGEGIGLAIVHAAVERMGGNVGLESEPGSGSRFWIELPRTVAH